MNLSRDIFKKVFNIRTKVSGYLKNITDNTIEYINTSCQIKNNKYIYTENKTTNTITKLSNELILNRDNSEINHTLIFNLNKVTKSVYYLKEFHHSLEFDIKTNYLEAINNKLVIKYKILQTNNEYEFKIEMSD